MRRALLFFAFAAACSAQGTFFGTMYGVATAAAPTFSPVAGGVASGTVVTISTVTPGCDGSIYWNNTGTPPTTSDTNGTTFTVTVDGTYRAAVLGCSGYADSSTATAAYTAVTPAVVQSNGKCGGTTSPTSWTCAPTSNVTAGNLLLVAENTMQATQDTVFSAPTAPCASGGFTQIGSTLINPTHYHRSSLWKATVTSSGACTVTMTNTHTNAFSLYQSGVYELRGITAVDASCTGVSGSSASTSPACSSAMTLTGAIDIVIGFAFLNTSTNITNGSGLTFDASLYDNTSTTCSITPTSLTSCTGGAESGTFTSSATPGVTIGAVAFWNFMGVSFK